ncbi:metallophosphoesterase [Stenotrophomonas pennii]|uniref:metallophosphoesterase n=1 Tax=Stenotrophomonas lacuserhaii TaxID=2760084 RepID=UPI003209EC91
MIRGVPLQSAHVRAYWLLSAAIACLLPFAGSAAAPVLQEFVFISDPQHRWTEKSDSGEPESNAEKERRSKLFINRQGLATMEYRMEFGSLDTIPLFINGDITAFGHGDERAYMYSHPFKQFYRRNFYVNLGNHDYQNNVNDCANNGCARDMYKDMAGWARSYPTRAFDHSVSDNGWETHRGSLAYSLVLGDILAIQLQNEPTYSVKFESARRTFIINDSLGFLETELKWAREAGKDVILNMHKPPYANWQSPDNPRFRQLMKDNEDLILGIFAGHLHGTAGKYKTVGTIPVYLSGAASRETFLTAFYNPQDRELLVFKVTGNDWRNNRKLVGRSKATSPRDASSRASDGYAITRLIPSGDVATNADPHPLAPVE